jgi:VWFA-related protein
MSRWLAGVALVAALAPQQRPVFRSAVDAVTIQASVRVGNRPVAGLVAADFELRDNGVVQQIASVAVEQVPVDLTFVLDLSGSVDGKMLQRLKAAVHDTAGLLRGDDRIRLVAVSQVLHEVFDLRPRDQALPLDTLTAEGATSLYDGLAAAMMHPSEPGRRQLVVAFTDGRDSSSIIDEATARQIARLTDVTVDIVVPVEGDTKDVGKAPTPYGGTLPTNVVTGSASELAARSRAAQPWAQADAVPSVLADLVSPTTGQVFTLTPDTSVSSVFRRLLDEFRASYVLQYMPQGVPPAAWHDVTVAVVKPGKYEIRARKGYAGPGENDHERPTRGSLAPPQRSS